MDVLNEPFRFKTSKLKRQYAFLWRDQLMIQRHGWRHLGFRRGGAAFVCVPHLRARYCQCTLGRGWQPSNPWKMWGWYDESRQWLVGIGHLGWLSQIFWLVGRFLLIFKFPKKIMIGSFFFCEWWYCIRLFVRFKAALIWFFLTSDVTSSEMIGKDFSSTLKMDGFFF